MKYSFCFFLVFVGCCSHEAFSQINKEKPLDSALEANSEKWKVKKMKGLFGLGRPQFGPYTTLVAEKMDSPVLRKKRNEGLGTGVSISSEGWDWDISKYKTFEKKKFYRIALSDATDTSELMFFIHSVSTEKQQTVLGKMLSKTDEGKDITLAYQKNIEGIILTGSGSTPAKFFIEDYISSKRITKNNPGQKEPITGGYIIAKGDSLFTEPIMYSFGKPKDKFFIEWQAGIFMNNANGVRMAAARFDQDLPSYIWIHKELDPEHRRAIAAFFALIISVENL